MIKLVFMALIAALVIAGVAPQPAQAIPPAGIRITPWNANPLVGATTYVTVYTSSGVGAMEVYGTCYILPIDTAPALGLVFTDPYPSTQKSFSVRLPARGITVARTFEIEPQRPGRYYFRCLGGFMPETIIITVRPSW
jgi:hypothetical protein